MTVRTLVTGASGLIGSQVVDQLSSRAAADVHAISRVSQPADTGVRWVMCDISRPGELERAIESVRPEVVIHLAGAVRGDRSLDAVGPTLRANLVATVELLEATTRLGCRRVVLSGSLLEEPASGGPAVTPPSPYGASRWAASAYGRMFHSLFGAPVVTLRPSFAYGPRQDLKKLVPHVISTLLDGGSPELSSGERRLDFVYSADVARAYVAAAFAPASVEGATIDIGCGNQRSVREVVEMLVEAVGPSAGRPEFGRLAVRPHEQEVEVDTEQAARTLGWRATTSLEDGLAQTVDWYRAERGRKRPGPSSVDLETTAARGA